MLSLPGPDQNDISTPAGQPQMKYLSLISELTSPLLGQVANDLEGGQDFLERIQVCIGDNLYL